MKREILCLSCINNAPHGVDLNSLDDMKRAIMDLEFSTRTIRGKAKGSYLCDRCNNQMEKGDDCAAMSTFRKDTYFKWEENYLEITR